MEAQHGFRLPVREAVDHDLAAIDQFQPPGGLILLSFDAHRAFGIGCLRRIGPDTAEIKRMFVEPLHRRMGAGRALLDELVAAAALAGYARVRLDSPDFMTAAHAMYRARGFVDIGPYPESEIPERAAVALGVHGALARRLKGRRRRRAVVSASPTGPASPVRWLRSGHRRRRGRRRRRLRGRPRQAIVSG